MTDGEWKSASYNLLDEDWIPVLYHDGSWIRVGIRKALGDAHRIRQIAATNPMDRVAILRFLLAILYWCKGNPAEDAAAQTDTGFPMDWFDKLDQHRDCFNLFGDGKRFYQAATAKRSRTATDLLQEIPTGNNFWHFRHSTDLADGLCPGCCAMGLLRLPLFSVSGLPDLKAGINGTPPFYVIECEPTLSRTVLANWTPVITIGYPAWTESSTFANSANSVPLLNGMTMLSRLVWLCDPQGPAGNCINCGSLCTRLIRTCLFESAGRKENNLWEDPHVIYSNETPRKALKAPDLSKAGRFRLDRPVADLLARITDIGTNRPTTVSRTLLVVGFATDKAKNVDVWERTVSLPPGSSILDAASSRMRHWDKVDRTLAQQMKGRGKSTESAALMASVRPQVEAKVAANVGDLLLDDDNAWNAAAQEYAPMMRALADSLSPGATVEAVTGRNKIAGLLPDINPKPGKEKTKAADKGGRK